MRSIIMNIIEMLYYAEVEGLLGDQSEFDDDDEETEEDDE